MNRVSSFKLQVASIMFAIVWKLTADDVSVSGIHDELEDDLLDWVRFTGVLVAGGYPHAKMSKTNPSMMAVEPAGGDLCRFILGDISVLLPRQMLIEAFRGFLSAIADHPCFALWFLCTSKLDAPEVEALREQADVAAKAAVAAGALEPLDPVGLELGCTVDAEDEFRAHYMAERVAFSPEEVAWVEKWRTTLKTHEIPKDWQP